MRLKNPVVIVNFKTYSQATGERALSLALLIEKAAVEAGREGHVAIALQPQDLRLVSSKVKIAVFAQHVDSDTYGANTGSILPEAVQLAGASGTLLNHAEKQISVHEIKETIKRCKILGLTTVVCANTPEKAAELSKLGPDFIADEPVELIGGTISVSKAKPEVVKRTVKKVHEEGNVSVLCGAGVHSKEDVSAALKLGSSGVLLASGVVLAPDPYKVMKELLKGL
jgi:triosephosphate isomerase